MGELIGSIHTKKGIKAPKQKEDALSRACEGLDKPVKKRTTDFARANEELIAAKERFRRENEQGLQAEAPLSERLRFEQLLSDLSARFVNVSSERLQEEIERALKMILDFFQVDRCGLVRTLPGKASFQITHAAYSEHVPPVPVGTELPLSLHPWAYEKLMKKGEVLAFSRLDDLPAEATVDKQTWMEWGIKSNLNIPILVGEPFGHIIAINSVKSECVWPEEIIPRLQLLGEIFVNALERSHRDQRLRVSEERLSLAAASAEVGLWDMDGNTGHVWVTDKLRELFQFAPDEALTFERFMEAIYPDDRERVKESVRKCLEKRASLRVEYRILLPDGSVRWIGSRGRFYPSSPGLPERLMGVSIDVTERKEMEDRLREQFEEIKRLRLQLEEENIYLRDEIMLQHGHKEIVARSTAMKQVLAQMEQVARTDATALIVGETGTGKDLLARTIHRLSNRKDRPLITINCAVLPPTLIESELFGREKGAYTGALTRMAGRFEVAHRSTLFLDEIGELSPDLQAKLLRVLEEGRFERLGSTKSIKVNVRIIAATNRDLAQEVAAGRFRRDLYYRLNVFPISIPPLRERSEDVAPLVWAFVKQYEKQLGKRIDHIPRRSMEAMHRYPWPGNVRELRNIVERAMITSSSGTLHLNPPNPTSDDTLTDGNLEDVERRHILSVLGKTGWRVTGKDGAAEILGMKRTTLQSKMKRLGIKRPTA